MLSLAGKLVEGVREYFFALEKECFREELRYSESELEERLARRSVLFLNLVVDGKPVGAILGYASRKDFYLDTLCVSIQGKGFGKSMLEFVKDWAFSKGYSRVLLDTEEVDEKGFRLVEFYKKQGFVVDSVVDGNVSMSFSF